MIDQFLAGELDEVYVVYTRMENSVQTDAEKLKLLPLEAKIRKYENASEYVSGSN